MRCAKCHSAHEPGANFCQHCGAALGLTEKKPQAGKWLLTALAVVLAVGLAVYFFKGILFPFPPVEQNNKPASSSATSARQAGKRAAPDKVTEKSDKPVTPLAGASLPAGKEIVPSPQAAPQSRLLPVGVVSVYDSWGNEIATISAVVVDHAWVALPVRGCLGGVEWFFRFTPSGFSTAIDGGQWRPGEEVGLWHLAKSLDLEPALLQPWQYQQKTVWRSLLFQRQIADLALHPDWQQGAWLHAANTALPDESGVLLQNGRVTGWTFGGWLGGGYLWAGPAGEGREMTVTVAEFYHMTFADGREEQFVRALAMDTGLVERLQAILAGFLFVPKLDARDVPESLQPANMLAEARSLADELYQQGGFEQLIGLLEAEVIRRTGDFGLLKIAADARLAGRGFADALDFVEKTGESLGSDGDQAGLQDLHLQLYQLWLEDELAKGELAAAAQVLARSRSFFADDPRLFLDGVELALAQGDWAGAEELLGQRVYPDTMAERADRLARRISQLKMQEGEIVIPFTSGSRQIHVTATINNRVTYPFLIDTGASVVSIPAALLPALGLKIDRNTPRFKVTTAGGVKEAWEITLSSIELEGWIVRNVRAMVVDSAEQVEFGLLGLNFLNRFQMHLDSDEGVLILRPQ
jgi:clan AA aspartic protease (TIGR02281 family)